jgi:hypothetical protein
MSRRSTFLLVLAFLNVQSVVATGQERPGRSLNELRVLYVGSERSDDYVGFLRDHVRDIQAAERTDFDPKQAAGFDVVLLDWPQGEETRDMRTLRAPLGSRQAWDRPTVLLGSAGLNMAVAWQMQGGSGCTCMDPLAYGFREHEIFNQPFEIPMNAMIRIKTPDAFADELDTEEIEVIPLVDDHEKKWRAGWCTYSTYFDRNPDVEFFCGGVNHKTPTAAGIWRQGNLLHYGFEQSPLEMNEHGRQLLLNSIAYISRFTEDRPIAMTPSVFGGPVARPRKTPANWLSRGGYHVQWVLDMFEPKTRLVLESIGNQGEQVEWCNQHADYFFPAQDQLLGIDVDLQSLMLPFDSPEFFDSVLSDLEARDGEVEARARRLLERYVPCGPGSQADIGQWRDWHKANEPYLFALDTGDYCWYIDPLAKRRQVPSAELRGPRRADDDVVSDAGGLRN